MGTDDEDRVRFPQPRWKLPHKNNHGFVAGISKYRQRPSTMGKIDNLAMIFH
jgi:hypothetical protein